MRRGIFALVVIGLLFSACAKPANAEEEVCQAYKDAVMGQLRSPSTATFPPCKSEGLVIRQRSRWNLEYERIANSGLPQGERDQKIAAIDGSLLSQKIDEWSVIGWVDAANAYGTPVRTTFITEVRPSTTTYRKWDVEITSSASR